MSRPGQAGTGAYPDSYYAASAHVAPNRPALDGSAETDIAIIGAGYTGLSAALSLAEKGYRVTVLEGARVGWGASGRNGGQIVNGLNAGLDIVERRYGADAAATIGGLLQEGARIIRARIADYGIDCDLKAGNLFAACNARHMRGFEAKQVLWRHHGMDDHELVGRQEMRDHVASDAYCGGMIDRSGGHMHPLNLALGEAAALESRGGVIHELSPAVTIERDRSRPLVHTPNGSLSCSTLLLCGNAYLGDVEPALAPRVMPVSTQMVATGPLGRERAAALLPTDLCVEDARYILDYFRLSADGRLLFGGGTVYGGTTPRDIEAKLRPNLEKVFPQLRDVSIEHAWSGNFALSFSRVPQIGRLDANVYFAHGYSGHGVTGSHLFGAILAEAVDGDLTRFDTLAAVPHLSFPGGRLLRVPYSVLGSWWYGLRDALGA